MDIVDLGIDGLTIVTPRRHGDARGWFMESWNIARFAESGVDAVFVQDNHAYSRDAGVLRGLHLQTPPHAQTKLVRCVAGAIWDVAVDVRRDSPSYGQWRGAELSARNGRQLLVPQGFLHGYLTLTPDAEVLYKVDDFYAADCERAVLWSDPDLAIQWPLEAAGVVAPVLSDKDAGAPAFADFDTPFAARTVGGAAT